MNQTNTPPFPDAERIRILNEYQEFLRKAQEQFDKFWNNTINLNPLDVRYDAALRFVQTMQKGDRRLRTLFDVPVHLNRLLRRMLMIRQIGESDDG